MTQKYQSGYGASRPITAAQKLGEIVCERLAGKDGKELPARFWDKPSWKRVFLLQVQLANSLLKVYTAEAVFRALLTDEGRRVYSLGATWLDPIVKAEQRKLDAATNKAIEAKPVEVADPTEKPRAPASTNQSIRSKLKGF